MNNKTRQHSKPDFRILDHLSDFLDDENRIDWDRRSRKLRSDSMDEDEVEVSLVEEVDEIDELLTEPVVKRKGKNNHRKKRRHLILDEDRGQVVVKRRRKSNRRYDDWHDEYE